MCVVSPSLKKQSFPGLGNLALTHGFLVSWTMDDSWLDNGLVAVQCSPSPGAIPVQDLVIFTSAAYYPWLKLSLFACFFFFVISEKMFYFTCVTRDHTEDTTSPECHKSRQKALRDSFSVSNVGLTRGFSDLLVLNVQIN